MEFPSHQLGIVKASPMTSIDDLSLRPSALINDIECISSPTIKKTNMDVMTSLSIGETNLSLTVVLQPTRKESLRSSFPGTLPIKNPHRRGHTEDFAKEQPNRFSFCSEDSGAGSSDFGFSFGGSYTSDLNGSQDRFYEAPDDIKNLRSENMQNVCSNESQIDPCFALGKEDAMVTRHEKGKKPSNHNLMRTIEYETFSDSRHEPHNNLLNLFPLPPSFQSSTSDQFILNMPRQAGALACMKRNPARQSILAQSMYIKNAMFDLQNITSHSYNTAAISRGFESFPDSNLMIMRVPSFDFDTYHGLTNDMRFTKLLFDPNELEHIANRPLSFGAGASIFLSDEPAVFTEEEDLKKLDIAPMKDINLEKAQLCIIKDDNGKEKTFKEVVQHGKTIVIFLRHFPCRQSQEFVKKISESLAPGTPARKSLDESKTSFVFIGSGSWKFISNYGDSLDPSFKLFTDSSTTSKLFRKMGLHTSLRGSFSAGLPQKFKQKFPTNDFDPLIQLRGVFCLENSLRDDGGVADLIKSPSSKLVTKEQRPPWIISITLAKIARKKSPVPQVKPTDGNLDSFRRSFVGTHLNLPEKANASLLRCTHAYRVKLPESDANSSQLFRSIGLDTLNDIFSEVS